MSDLHECLGVITPNDDNVMVCACVSKDMFHKLEAYFREEVKREVTGFASEYHHHIEGRDVVIVDQLLDFLTPVEGKEEDGLGTTG